MRRLIGLLFICFFFALGGVAQRGGPPRRISNPRTIHLEHGARVDFSSFFSEAVGEEVGYSVFIPSSYDQESDRGYPVAYFLHGMFNDHTSWAVERYGNIPRQLEAFMQGGEIPESLFVHPDGDNGLYTNFLDGTKRYEDLIYKDLVQHIERDYRVAPGRENRSLGGVSMGAYGALKIAIKHSDEFAATAGVSPIVFLGPDPSRQILESTSRMAQFFKGLLEPVFGIPFDGDHWRQNSLETLARTEDLNGLKIYFSYGTADRYADLFPMEEGIRTLDGILTERGADHVFKSYQGEPHGWDLVTGHLEEVVKFLSSTF